jgi:hypothetical protein
MDCPCIFEVAWIGHARQQTPAGHPQVAATIDCSKGNVTNKYYFQKHIDTSYFVDLVKSVASFLHTLVVTSAAAPVSTAAPHYRSARGRTLRQGDAKRIKYGAVQNGGRQRRQCNRARGNLVRT